MWEDSLCLIADLLFGNGMDRYVGAIQGPDSPLEVMGATLAWRFFTSFGPFLE